MLTVTCPLSAWCERGELNPHGCPLDPKSSASTCSATLALVNPHQNSLKTIPGAKSQGEERETKAGGCRKNETRRFACR